MRRRKLVFITAITNILFISSAFSFQGQIDFTAAEIKAHDQNISTLISTAKSTIEKFTAAQAESLRTCNVGYVYGYLSSYTKFDNAIDKDKWVVAHATCNNPPQIKDIWETSCEIYANRFISYGFDAIGQTAVYSRINQFLNDNDRDGLALTYALRKLGWKIIYWNTDLNAVPDLPESDRDVVGITREDHILDTQNAMKNAIYYGVAIDGYAVNFAPLSGSSTKLDDSGLKGLAKVPYYIGISHAGYHVWSGSYGSVIESHSSFDPDSRRNIESGTFLPPYSSPVGRIVDIDGQRHKYYYYSGIIAIPPGPWVWF